MALWLFNEMERPTQLLDQHFGLGLYPDDLMAPLTIPHGRHVMRTPAYYRPWRVNRHQDTGSTVKVDKDKFQVNLDVQQFSPEELTVKAVDNTVVIEGKHEEKEDEHGFISRHFVRRYVLPQGHDAKHVVSSLSSDGVLTVTAPKKENIESKERVITITHTGNPHKAVKDTPKEDGDTK